MQIPLEQWQAEAGDRFIADTKENTGYLVHADGHYLQFLIGSGQKRFVRYLGMTYNAATPSRHWTVKSTHIQSDRFTFGPNGHFMRLYKDGDIYTSYGIHSIKNIDKVLASDLEKRYLSMGCIIVSEEVLGILGNVYALNGGSLDVYTTHGLEELVAMR